MIKIEHLVKNYGSICAVDDVSFSVKKGEIVGLEQALLVVDAESEDKE